MRKYILPIISGLLFIGLIVLVKTYDVSAIGPLETSVGLASINNYVHNLTGVNMFWYNLTDLFGFVAIGVVGTFGLIGFIQLIKRKSLFEVDNDLFLLGILYVIILSIYILFEVKIINYRPVIMPGETLPESSFPSSHTILIIVVMASAIVVLDNYVKNVKICKILKVLFGIILVITVVGRLLSGAHWFSDILGGILISTCLISTFCALRNY